MLASVKTYLLCPALENEDISLIQNEYMCSEQIQIGGTINYQYILRSYVSEM